MFRASWTMLRKWLSRKPQEYRPRRKTSLRLESLEDRVTPAAPMFTVVNTADSGAGSLRQAILNANNAAGPSTINFNVPSTGVQTINLLSALPTIARPVNLDATTQPGYAGTPLIDLNGAGAGLTASGLVLVGGNSAVKGLEISNFAVDGLIVENSGNNVIAGDFIGTNAAGTSAAGNHYAGLIIAFSSNNFIGPNNVLSGNGVYGLVVYAGVGNVVQGDFIGTNLGGTAAVPNGLAGVDVQGASRGDVFSYDVVGGNGGFGFIISDPGTSGNTIANCFIGVAVNGTTALANGFAGVGVGNGAANNTIGGAAAANRDVISGNGAFGVIVAGTFSNLIENDFIGLTVAGTAALGNGVDGVSLQDGAANNGVVSDVISGNGVDGVAISGAGTTGNVILFSRIGTNAGGAAALGNGVNGVLLRGGATGNGVALDVIAGQPTDVEITNAFTSNNAVNGCYIGLDATGTVNLEDNTGVSIDGGADNNSIGGMVRNVIDGRMVALNLSNSTGDQIIGNFFGLRAAGDAAPTGRAVGVGLQFGSGADNNTISFNVVSACSGDNIDIGGKNNTLLHNYIGLNAAGNAALSNPGYGIAIFNSGNTVGGAGAGNGNVISGNTLGGVDLLLAAATGNLIEGNLIGLAADGLTPAGNGGQGIIIQGGAFNNTVGGTAAGAGNVIAFNGDDGVLIGGLAPLNPKTLTGVGNAVLGNSIFSNGKIGIDLGADDGVTANGFNNNVGPNNYANYPTLTSVASVGGSSIVTGTLHSTPKNSFRIEFFVNPFADASNHGQGKTFIGFTTAFTNSNGDATFAAVLPAALTVGQVVSATATDAAGNTSEFSADFIIPNAPIVTQLGNVTPTMVSTVPGNGDVNPYGIAFVPANFPTGGTLQPGDILIANFNNANNIQGTGTTITRVTAAGQTSTFFTSAALGTDTGLVVLQSGLVIVANVPNVNNGMTGQGSLQVLDKNGNLVKTITDMNLLNGPWDLAANDKGATVQVFVSNVNLGIVSRLDLSISGGNVTVNDTVQIASGYMHRLDPAAFVVGPGGLAYDPVRDVLYVATQLDNEIFEVAHAGTVMTTQTGTGIVLVADQTHLHGPIGMVLAPNGDLIVADSDAVNADPNQPSELVEYTTTGQFVGQFSIDPNNGGAFGIGVASSAGRLLLAATDDNTNMLSVWTL
jgi:titin